MSTYIDIHILQNVPPSNLNRDDTGAPKSAMYGGVRRARTSSQAWKRATREDFRDYLDAEQLGFRTTRLVSLVEKRIAELDQSLDDAKRTELAAKSLEALGMKPKTPRAKKGDDSGETDTTPRTEYLMFLSTAQIDALARLALEHPDGKIPKAAARAAANSDHGIDLAVFGRMVADDAGLNVDSAVQVAHAISTHPVEIESDYYTAVDDTNEKEDSGAGMIGTVEFNSAVLYRYANINVDGLAENLGDPATTAAAAAAFVRSFARSMPTGKQNTFANRTLPEAIVIAVREDHPVNLVGAFENPVLPEDGLVKQSAVRLAEYADGVTATYGNAPAQVWRCSLPGTDGALDGFGEAVSFDELVGRVEAAALAVASK
ncbi:type I-E CRISPR-associated protein Cas7/Cse4/CasC [Epidermidibacterium keratini]|uniref:Type I-E CRISPR-associated protein Cas7/Cse4/CasC n=1 Tax=Epidermidibacterium keratini TaxID=1891644 RepID=A0A7L4YMX7_9ACTN|nr:type I-E CRISPR-associated protein Cas7/Cse4/CasC [Epidermidibacterium keratini]QHC00194.1 type I-E CRISPR-associated protein Cas7/Cse4/CasC [Epidermidibacterium keratini]